MMLSTLTLCKSGSPLQFAPIDCSTEHSSQSCCNNISPGPVVIDLSQSPTVVAGISQSSVVVADISQSSVVVADISQSSVVVIGISLSPVVVNVCPRSVVVTSLYVLL